MAAVAVVSALCLHTQAFVVVTAAHRRCTPAVTTARACTTMQGAERDAEERRRKLAELYGAENLPEEDRPRPSAADVQPLLEEGVLRQPWGALTLIDVNGAETPLTGTFEPVLPDPSELLVMRLDMPLGMLIEEAQPGRVEVVELAEGGGAYGKVEPGDVLRATTACMMAMSYPAWQVMLGGVGRPSVQKKLLPVAPGQASADSASAAQQTFEDVMGAIQSNADGMPGGNGQVILIIERASSS